MAQKRQESSGDVEILRKELGSLKALVTNLHEAVDLLETEKDNLRQAVRKLKAENLRTKEKLKKFAANFKSQGVEGGSDDEDFPEYDEIGRDFILVGGSHDPLAIRYEAPIKDKDGVEHKTVERYYWTRMAEHFNDNETRTRILEAPNTIKAEEAMKDLKNFDEKAWDEIKLKILEEGQQLKFEQNKWISNVLIETGTTYIAVCHQDKQIGTGWRKNREESNKPLFWDGKNLAGKFLMKLRKSLAANHSWKENEHEVAKQKVNELRRYVWRRLDNNYRGGSTRGRGYTRGHRHYNSGSRGGHYEKRGVYTSSNGKN